MTATRIPVELFAEIEGDDVLIKVQPLDRAAVTLLQYSQDLPDRCKSVAAIALSLGSTIGESVNYTGVLVNFQPGILPIGQLKD